jgi:putative transposase
LKPSKIHHVSWTTIRRAKQLAEKELAAIVMSFITNARELNQCLLGGYAVLPDEVHIVFAPKGSHTSETVTRYVRRASERLINRQLNRTGEVWDDAVTDTLVKDATQLAELLRKIEYLPCKAGIVKYPSEYKFSSAHADSPKDALSDLFA